MSERIAEAVERARSGGAPKYHQKLAEQGKLFVRERLRVLLDDADGFAEEGLMVSALAGDLPADGVVTGVGEVHGRPVAVMANDPTVKAGSWGPPTGGKLIRIGERVTLEEMGGARMHAEVSGSGDLLVPDDEAAIEAARAYLTYFPQSFSSAPAVVDARPPALGGSLAGIVPTDESKPFDVYALI